MSRFVNAADVTGPRCQWRIEAGHTDEEWVL